MNIQALLFSSNILMIQVFEKRKSVRMLYLTAAELRVPRFKLAA